MFTDSNTEEGIKRKQYFAFLFQDASQNVFMYFKRKIMGNA